MSWSRSDFIDMLQVAIADHRHGRFGDTIKSFRANGDIVLGDDGSFEALCDYDNYVVFIHKLLDCWVDSARHPTAYPYIRPTEWVGFAKSLLDDIEQGRIPSHAQWNNIFTLECDKCHQQTELRNGRFRCEQCERNVEFRSPSLKRDASPPNAT